MIALTNATSDFEYTLAMEAITEREGQDVLNSRIKEGGREQVEHHFNRNYRTLHIDTAEGDIVRTARALLDDGEFLYLLDNHNYAAPLDVLYSEGVVSLIGNYYIVSAEYRKANYPVLR